MSLAVKRFWRNFRGPRASAPPTEELFREQFEANLRECTWKPHPLYSVFTQYDQEWYLAQQEAFMHKYLCFYAVSKTISPRKIIELGACAGASGDPYLSAAPEADYLGLDVFGVNFRQDDGTEWDPYKIAEQLFYDRGFKNWQLLRTNLRTLKELPAHADFVVVDAAHDFDNEYADLQLALTADPEFIFVDDADDENAAKPAIEKFLNEDLKGKVAYTFGVNYVGGGLVIKLQGGPRTQ
jgi:predicted O-methyltransferase YrrM